MLVSHALGDSIRIYTVLGYFACAWRLLLEALIDEFRFDGASGSGSITLDYPSRAMLRSGMSTLVEGGFVRDRTVKCLSANGFACCTLKKVVAHVSLNLVSVWRRSFGVVRR